VKIGDKVAVQTKYFGKSKGVVTSVDKNGFVAVRHNAPGHPSGETYAHPRDVIVLAGTIEIDQQVYTYTSDGKLKYMRVK
jgi:hypothetical protein